MRRRRFISFIKNPIQSFLKVEAASGILLALSAAVAMIVANSAYSAEYFQILKQDIFGLSVQHWINDGLMAIFFFVIGLELKKEFLVGELSSMKKAALPMAAALGGMVVPALIYWGFNPSGSGASGWGIPMATDIAFAVGILSLFGKRVPLALKVFLLALAIVDDLGAILVIAVFYTNQIRYEGLLAALVVFGLVYGAQKNGVRSYLVYTILGIVAWAGILYSGVHATVAGVLLGLATPLHFRVSSQYEATYSPLDNLVHWLHPWVSFGIMPVFAFANAGISLSGISFSEMLTNPIHLGVLTGLAVGKPLGIFVFSRLSVKLGFASLPTGVSWAEMLGLGFLGGVGFTMALFISALALPVDLETFSKTGIVLGSVIAGALGAFVLVLVLPKSK